MERLKLNFDSDTDEGQKAYIVEVPYKNGMVVTSEFCPMELLAGKVELLAAIRGEPLDKFLENCWKQVLAMSRIEECESALDIHIGGLMAVVMDHLSRERSLTLAELLLYMDCFSLLLKGAGFEDHEISEIYPRVAKAIQSLYSDQIAI